MTPQERAALEAERDEIAARHPLITGEAGRRYTRIVCPSGEYLLDRFTDGTATLSTRLGPGQTWGPPQPVTVVDGYDDGFGAA